MSYILDALQHREAQDNPDTAVQMVIKRHKDQRNRMLWLVVSLALLVNGGVVIWLLLPGAQTATEPTAQTTPAPALTPAPAKAPAAPAPGASAQTPVVQTTPEAAAPVPPAAVAAPTREPLPRKIRSSLEGLPASTRARFPGLVFSTHIYAEDPSLRAIVVNGRRLTEGGSIAGATLEHVTATGVVMEFDDYLVEIPVIDDWQ